MWGALVGTLQKFRCDAAWRAADVDATLTQTRRQEEGAGSRQEATAKRTTMLQRVRCCEDFCRACAGAHAGPS